MVEPHIGDPAACGVLLRKLRIEAGYSSRQAASLIGVSPSSLIQWEVGNRLPLTESLILVLKFYGITATIGAPPVTGQVRS